MFNTPSNRIIRDEMEKINSKMVDRLNDISNGKGMFNDKSLIKGMGNDRIKKGGTREKEFETSEMMELPTNTNLPKGTISTLNSNLYLPVKQSGSYQTPNSVLQYYHNGGIQGAGQADYLNVEKVGGAKNKKENALVRLIPVISLLSGKNKQATKRILMKMKKNMGSRKLKMTGSGMMDDIFNTIKSEAPKFIRDNLPEIIKHSKMIINKIKGGKGKDDEDETANNMVESYVGGGFFDDLWEGVKNIGATALNVLPSILPHLLGAGDATILPPLGYSGKIEDLRGTVRPPTKKLENLEGGLKLSKAKQRGLIIKQIMKEKNYSLGEASKFLSAQTKK